MKLSLSNKIKVQGLDSWVNLFMQMFHDLSIRSTCCTQVPMDMIEVPIVKTNTVSDQATSSPRKVDYIDWGRYTKLE
jgi:hypothetical protein